MMFGMSRRIDRNKSQVSDHDFPAILRHMQFIFWNRQELTPQGLHAIPINSGGAGDQLLRVQHVRRTDGMHKYFRALSRQPASRAGMVEVNMCEQDVSQVTG